MKAERICVNCGAHSNIDYDVIFGKILIPGFCWFCGKNYAVSIARKELNNTEANNEK